MKRKYFKLLFLIVLSLYLVGCGKKEPSAKDDLSVILEDGQSITLYMEREEVEKIIGKPTSEAEAGKYNYGAFKVGYTDNKLSNIILYEENCKTKSGLSVNTDIETIESKNFATIIGDMGNSYYQYYKYDNNNFYVTEKPEKVDTLFTNASISISTWKGKIISIGISDILVGVTGQFDD